MNTCKDAYLIQELKSKFADRNTSNFGVSDFLAAFGSPIDAMMYLRLFWPNFVRFEGMVFREESLEDEDDERLIRDALTHFGDNRTKTEESFNLVEIPSGVFSTGEALESPKESVNESLADYLVELWTLRLSTQFPNENFVVEKLSAEVTGGEIGVVFYTCQATPSVTT